MAGFVSVTTTKDTFTPFVQALPGKVDIAKNVSGYNISRRGATLMKRQLGIARIKKFRGELFNGIKAKKVNKNTWGIFIPRKGVFLDSMKPHWVALKKGRLITQWAEERGVKGRAIKVHPHPFIDAGFRSLVATIPSELEQLADKIVR